jgi:hypothetical protein
MSGNALIDHPLFVTSASVEARMAFVHLPKHPSRLIAYSATDSVKLR